MKTICFSVCLSSKISLPIKDNIPTDLFFHLRLVHGVQRRAIVDKGTTGGYEVKEIDDVDWEVEVCIKVEERKLLFGTLPLVSAPL